ncbi:MAG: TolC family protein [Calditrichae bacterium]|nr:TolC family protein [Calditrichota bacterium]MCB9058470.1 TolC family protein [Calditrichia bacterium]
MRIIKILSMLFLVVNVAQPQSLNEAIQLALDNNNIIKAVQDESAAARQEWDALKKDALPSVSFDASYRHVTDVATINFPATPISPARDISLGVYDTYESSINAKYILFSGFAETEAQRVKEFEYKISKTDQLQTEKDIAYNTIEAYRNVQFFILNIKTLNDALKRNDVQAGRVKSLLNNGMALALDTLSLSLARTNIKQQLIRSATILDNWRQILKSLTGADIKPQESAENVNPHYADYSFEAQNSFQSLKFRQDMLASVESLKKSEFYPKVFIGASLKYGKPGVDFINNEWMAYGVWNVGLSWDLWSWGADQARVDAVKLQRSALKYREQSLKDQLDLKYNKAERDYKSLNEQYVVAKKAVRVASEKMRIIEINAEKGQLSVSDFNDANLELSQAELNQQQSLIMLNLKANEIDYLSGQPISNWSIN